MKRRGVAALNCSAVLWPSSRALSQSHGSTRRLGMAVQAPRIAAYWVVFSHELQKYRYSEGRNLLVIDGFDTQVDRAEQIAKTIVAQRPDAIVTAVAFTKLLQGAK